MDALLSERPAETLYAVFAYLFLISRAVAEVFQVQVSEEAAASLVAVQGGTSAPAAGNSQAAATLSFVQWGRICPWTLIVSQMLPAGRSLPDFREIGRALENSSV